MALQRPHRTFVPVGLIFASGTRNFALQLGHRTIIETKTQQGTVMMIGIISSLTRDNQDSYVKPMLD